MAKRMAKLEGGVVVNTQWHADRTPETDTLKDIQDRPVALGDTWDAGRFYRGGEAVLSPLEAAQLELQDMRTALATLGVSVDG